MNDDVRAAIIALDGKKTWGAAEDAREALLPFGRAIFPAALELYPRLRGHRARVSLVYTAMKFALVEEDAVRLGLAALRDRSARVVHFACMLLAVSGRNDAVAPLEALLSHASAEVRGDAEAAIAAIRAGDRNRFLDRTGSGNVTLNIGGLIEPRS